MVIVHPGGSVGAWVEQEHEGAHLQEIIEGNELEDDSGELVDNGEDTEANPVGEPLLVIILTFGLESNETLEAWIGNSDDLGDVSLSDSHHDEEHGDSETVSHNLLWLETGGGSDL